jgi:hypothetical protein
MLHPLSGTVGLSELSFKHSPLNLNHSIRNGKDGNLVWEVFNADA